MYCLSIGNKNYKSVISEIRKYEMAEIRLDLCDFTIEQTETLFGKHSNLIATFRKHSLFTDPTRKTHLKKAIHAGARWVDIDFENDSYPFRREVMEYAKSHACNIIISVHDFEKTPDSESIQKLITEIKKQEPDLIKLVFFAQIPEDNERVLELYQSNSHLIAFNMGKTGKPTRVRSLQLGAPFAYVRSGKHQTADGQMTIEEMMQYS